MLKLNELYNNKDLAEMLLKNWQYDKEDENLYNWYRISANAIYWYLNNGKRNFLRFKPYEEAVRNPIEGEIEFINYLIDKNFPANRFIESKSNKYLEKKSTPWGDYHCTSLKGVSGKQLSSLEMTKDLAYKYGELLGYFHQCSRSYDAQDSRRMDLFEILEWTKKEAMKRDLYGAVKESEILIDFFKALPQNENDYGMIHFDFEPDNVFYDEASDRFGVIDFDDSMVHFYVMDIVVAMESIKDEYDNCDEVMDDFIAGYEKNHTINHEIFKSYEMFLRFSNLYGYLRVVRSLEDRYDNEPEWIINLRGKLESVLEKRSAFFGRETK